MSGFIRLLAFRYPPRVVAACPARTCRYAHATSAILFTHSHPLLPLEGGRNEADSVVTYIHHLGRQTRMCLGIPMQITAIDGHGARGDYVLVHVGFAILRLDPRYACETQTKHDRLVPDGEAEPHA